MLHLAHYGKNWPLFQTTQNADRSYAVGCGFAVQSLKSCPTLAAPGNAARQAPLSFINPRSLLILTSTESVCYIYTHLCCTYTYGIHTHPHTSKARMGRLMPSLSSERKKGKSRSEERKGMTETLPSKTLQEEEESLEETSGKGAAEGAARAVLSAPQENRYMKKKGKPHKLQTQTCHCHGGDITGSKLERRLEERAPPQEGRKLPVPSTLPASFASPSIQHLFVLYPRLLHTSVKENDLASSKEGYWSSPRQSHHIVLVVSLLEVPDTR